MHANVFRDRLLEGKVAFLTGGGSGITLRIAERFAEQGARVALMGRTAEKLEKAVAAIGANALATPGDVRDYAAVEAALARTREAWGEIDIVVCGAAGNFPAPVLGMSANGFKAVVDIDLLGTFNTCRAAYQHLRRPGASIINISATFAFDPMPFQAHVCAAKAGIDQFSKTLALEWGPQGVRVNVISPGPIDETEGMKRLAATQEIRDRVIKGVPLRRLGTKDDIADLAVFLSSCAATYVTGAIMVCDGGQSLGGHGF